MIYYVLLNNVLFTRRVVDELLLGRSEGFCYTVRVFCSFIHDSVFSRYSFALHSSLRAFISLLVVTIFLNDQ